MLCWNVTWRSIHINAHRLHPAYVVAGIEPEDGGELCVQEAYTPESTCWGCGELLLKHEDCLNVAGCLQAVSCLPRYMKSFALPGHRNVEAFLPLKSKLSQALESIYAWEI